MDSNYSELTQNEKNTHLLNAAERGDVEQVQALLQAGANKDTVNPEGDTPLILAVYSDHHDVVEKLVAARANLEHPGEDGETALILASGQGYTNVVAKLIEAGAKLEAVGQHGKTALICAARSGYSDVVRQLIAKGANIEVASQNGQTPLMHAASFGHTEVVAQLIAAGANLEATDKDNDTVLMFPAGENREDTSFLLLNALSSKRVNRLLHEPNLAPIIKSFHDAINRAKIETIKIFRGLFSEKKQKIPVALINLILDFIFPAWLRGRKDLQIKEIPELKKLYWGKERKAVMSSAAQELPAQAPVAVTFRHSAAANKRKEKEPSKKRRKPNGN